MVFFQFHALCVSKGYLNHCNVLQHLQHITLKLEELLCNHYFTFLKVSNQSYYKMRIYQKCKLFYKVKIFFTQIFSFSFQPSTLALALLSNEISFITDNWADATIVLQEMAKVCLLYEFNLLIFFLEMNSKGFS